ncbi:TonB-dependent receptor [Novosphingobium beihaiensis]|uniref:TonB-dependent receptor n=1 Tax=Novosphingobium beihaiensis TaxID=2930389 RepID=A0ABT0BL64_9SPHN|nr:TonB-dependent receptor [Novosphingobium beihaiensis]MCJ2185782.1 TonB-dependent receptor [Novosphingobium beihaiensis]
MAACRYLLLFPTLLALTPAAQARTAAFAIPGGSLAPALTAFSKATGIQVIADPAVLKGLRTRGVRGTMPEERALAALLRGTGLTYRRKGGVVLILPGHLPDASGLPRTAKHTAPGTASRSAGHRQTGADTPITVIGQRFADQRALDAKRRMRNIADALSIDEVRRLPDSTVADAMRRIPGVSVLPVADNEHPRDVPIAPVVRGLTQAYNNVTIDGMPIASTGIPDAGSNSASRGVRLDILPASAVSRLLVIKTFTPDLDPNAIGGAIDLQTRSAFGNHGAPFLSLEAGLARPSRHSQVQPQSELGPHATATASRTFGPDHRFGVVISASYRHLDNNSDVHGTSDSGYLNFYKDDGTRAESGSTGNGIPVPRQDKYWYNGSDRRQWGVTARAEADLGTLRLSALAADLVFRDGFTRNEIIIDPEGPGAADQTATSGRFEAGAIQTGYRHGITRNETQIARFGAAWSPGEEDRITIDASFSRAMMRERYDMVKFTAGLDAEGKSTGSPLLGFAYDTAPLQFSFNPPPSAYTDLSLYAADYWRHRSRTADSRIEALRAGWRHNTDRGNRGFGFATGVSATRSTYAYGFSNEAYETTDRGLTLADAGYVSAVRLPFNQNGLPLLVIDPARAWQMFEDNRSVITRTDNEADELQNDFRHAESSLDGYGMIRFASGRFEALAGARLDYTRLSTRGYIGVADTWSPHQSSAHYVQLLPSVLVNFRLAAGLRLRAGYSRTISRPSYEDYAPRSSIDFATGATPGDGDAQGVSVRLGNPGIKPRLSDNFDLSAEWTLPGAWDGMVSAAAFHKAIRNEIFDATTTGYTYGGVYYRFARVFRPANATAAHISGLELSAVVGSLEPVTPLLRHVGFSANWTLLDGKLTVPLKNGSVRALHRLVGQPGEIRNLSVFFNDNGFELRGAMNWTGRALRSIVPGRPWEDAYWAPRRQFDMQARYHFTRGFSVILDVSNLTEERLTSLTGPGMAWLKDSYSVPRTIRLSLHWGLNR